MKTEEIVAIQCKSCSKPIVITGENFHCVGCSVAMLHQTLAPRSKRERLRRWRKIAYEFLILSLIFCAINYYCGAKFQFIATGVYVLPSILPFIGDRLSRIF